MKIRNLLLSGMCMLSMGTFAQKVVMFHETFGTNAFHQAESPQGNGEFKAQSNPLYDAYKVGGQFYFTGEPVFIHGDWGVVPSPVYPDASLGSYLAFSDDGAQPKFTIQVNTSSKPYVLLSYAHSIHAWVDPPAESSTISVWYSFDNGETYTQFDKSAANVGEYGSFQFIEHTENIGGKSCVYIQFRWISGAAMMDDIIVTGYDVVPANKAELNKAIAETNGFLEGEGMTSKYCIYTTSEFTNGEAYTNAMATKNSETATQEEVDAATTALTVAFEALKATVLDFTALQASIDAVESGEYATDEHVVAPLAAAKKVVANGSLDDVNCATQADVDATTAALEQAALDAIGVEGAAVVTGVYPNPAIDYIQIAGIEGGIVYIFNAVGQQVLSVSDYNGEAISVSGLASGVYTAVYGKQAVPFIKK